jgi:hypothetical protein
MCVTTFVYHLIGMRKPAPNTVYARSDVRRRARGSARKAFIRWLEEKCPAACEGEVVRVGASSHRGRAPADAWLVRRGRPRVARELVVGRRRNAGQRARLKTRRRLETAFVDNHKD